MSATLDPEKLCNWGKPKFIPNTRHGPRMLRSAALAKRDDPFWEHWRDPQTKAYLRSIGVSVSKDRGGAWQACWWAEPPKEVTEKLEANKEASRLEASDAVIPAPEGCEYRPFQKAGILCALKMMGVDVQPFLPQTTNR